MLEIALKLLKKIEKSGFSAYIVGGFVRDYIMGRNSADVDIATNATPKQLREIFPNSSIAKEAYGSITVVLKKVRFEITTFRRELTYYNNRKPIEIEYIDDLLEDLKRRDFTINSMAYNEKEGLVDLFGGQKDLDKKIIKTVGNPYDRFNEDGLRMVRAIRFSSKLDFDMEEETLLAIYDNAKIIENISLERITDEFTKIILSNKIENLIYLFKTKLLNYLNISEENDEEKINKLYEEIKIINKMEMDITKRLVVLDYFIEKLEIKCKSLCEELIYSKKIIKDHNTILSTLKNIKMEELDKFAVKKILNEIGRDLFQKYLDISEIIFKNAKNTVDILREIEENNECYTIKNLKVNGNDIISLGYENKEIGKVLDEILNEVMKNPSLNDRNYLMKRYKKSN